MTGERVATIYALIDPRTEQVRYIGQTVNPMWRYSDHLCASNGGQATPTMAMWVKDLAEARAQPRLSVLDRVPEHMALFVEAQYITLARDAGANLLNVQCYMRAGRKALEDGLLTRMQRYLPETRPVRPAAPPHFPLEPAAVPVGSRLEELETPIVGMTVHHVFFGMGVVRAFDQFWDDGGQVAVAFTDAMGRIVMRRLAVNYARLKLCVPCGAEEVTH